MMLQDDADVCRRWTAKHHGSTRRLRSDGIRLWSYDRYELARHVGRTSEGVLLAYIRDSTEKVSRTTSRQLGILESVVRLAHPPIITLPTVGRGPAPTRDDDRISRLAQPDWEWLSWCDWFEAAAVDHDYEIYVRPDAKTTSPVLRQARRLQCPLRLVELDRNASGFGFVHLGEVSRSVTITLEGGIKVSAREGPRPRSPLRVDLNHFMASPRDDPQAIVRYVAGRLTGAGWRDSVFRAVPEPAECGGPDKQLTYAAFEGDDE